MTRIPRSVTVVAAPYRRLATLWVLVPALIAMIVLAALFQVTGRMVSAEGATGLELQKAFTVERFGAVVAAWGEGVVPFKWSLITLDFTFPIVYAAALASLVALAGGSAPGPRVLGLFALPWAAAALDWGENLAHLWLLSGIDTAADAAAASYSSPLVMAASLAAMLKFALLLTTAAGAAGLALHRRRWWLAAVGAVLFASFTPVLWA